MYLKSIYSPLLATGCVMLPCPDRFLVGFYSWIFPLFKLFQLACALP